jgi:hypothetical protein
MLFVFGKRAKQLRHNKVSELIHKSEKFPHLGFCKVSVYFQEIIDKVGALLRRLWLIECRMERMSMKLLKDLSL